MNSDSNEQSDAGEENNQKSKGNDKGQKAEMKEEDEDRDRFVYFLVDYCLLLE